MSDENSPLSTKPSEMKRKLTINRIDDSSPSQIASTSKSAMVKKMKLPHPLQLPDTIPELVVDVLKNKPYHPRFYQARVTMLKKAREFFAGLCPYATSEEYEAMVSCICRNFPHLSDPGVKESDPP